LKVCKSIITNKSRHNLSNTLFLFYKYIAKFLRQKYCKNQSPKSAKVQSVFNPPQHIFCRREGPPTYIRLAGGGLTYIGPVKGYSCELSMPIFLNVGSIEIMLTVPLKYDLWSNYISLISMNLLS